jgi:hypothetical protein
MEKTELARTRETYAYIPAIPRGSASAFRSVDNSNISQTLAWLCLLSGGELLGLITIAPLALPTVEAETMRKGLAGMRRILLYVVAVVLFAGGGIFLAMQLSAYLDHGSFRGLLVISGATPMSLGAYIFYEDFWKAH